MKLELQATCPFCCLHCADLRLTIDGGRLTRFSPPCRPGRSGYDRSLAVLATTGQAGSPPRSTRRLLSLLDSARRLLVVLSEDVPDEAVAGALQLAQKHSALLVMENETSSLLSHAMQTAGYLSGILGEPPDPQAVLFCGVDHRHTHPCLGDLAGREVLANALSLNPEDLFEALRWLRLGLADPDQAVPKKLADFLNLTRSASTGILFFGQQWLSAGQPVADELLLWLRNLNRSGRWYAYYLSPGANFSGVTGKLLSLSGYAASLRLAANGSVTPLPHLAAAGLIGSGWPDLCLLVGQPRSFSEQTLASLRRIKTVLLDPQPPAWKPSLWLPVAQAGVDAPGSMSRLDGLPLLLEPILPSSRPSIQSLLAGLTGELPS